MALVSTFNGGVVAPTHDLIRVADPSALSVEAQLPLWARASLRRAPWVVVRRGYVRTQAIPVGVRGAERHQRLAALLPAAEIREQLAPEDLADPKAVATWGRKDPVAALDALARVAPVLDRRGCRWGPIGSVGFEIASRVETATCSSDLDLIVRQDIRLDPDEAADLLLELVTAAWPARVDVLLETPRGGLSLADLAARPDRILVRTPDCARLVTDIWGSDVAATRGSMA